MVHRPVDENGDILPVRSSTDLLRGPEAVAQVIRERLELYAGDWWENPSWGNEILEMMRQSRLTEADGQALAAYLSSYVRETEGVEEVKDVAYSIGDKGRFFWQCTVMTGDGAKEVTFEI